MKTEAIPIACGLSRHRLREEIGHLSPQDRAIFLLRTAAHLRYDKISTALSIPVETVTQGIARAREQLRSRLFFASDASELP